MRRWPAPLGVGGDGWARAWAAGKQCGTCGTDGMHLACQKVSAPPTPLPEVTSAACTPRRRVGVEARRLDTPALRAAGVKCTAGSNAWPSRVGRLRLGAARRAAGLDVSGCRKPASVSAFHRRQSPRSCADQIVDGVQDTKPAARLMSAARRAALRIALLASGTRARRTQLFSRFFRPGTMAPRVRLAGQR